MTKQKILKRYALPFAFSIACLALTRTSGKSNIPMFYVSLLDDYYGLSNHGFEVRDAFKCGLSRKTYKHIQGTKFQSFQAKTEEAMKNGLVVGGADNFNQQYFTSRIDLKKTPHELQWLCWGCFCGPS